MQSISSQKTYLEKMEILRVKMEKASKQHGITHPLVLKYSQELDQIHNLIIALEISQK